MSSSSVERLRSWVAPLALATLIGGGLQARTAFREDEVQCEEAVAHLESCCPDFDPSVVTCEYVEGCSSDTCPDLSVADARELRELDCEEIRRGGECERVVMISEQGLETSEDGSCH